MLKIRRRFFVPRISTVNLSRLVRLIVGFSLLGFLAANTVYADPLAAYKLRHYQLQSVQAKPQAPDFLLDTAAGGKASLAMYRGQVVVINFWSTWCAPCRKEMPSLERAWQQLKSDNVVVLGIAIQDEPEMVARFIGESGITFPILLDADGAVTQVWPFSGIPATFVLDPSGRIIYQALGLREWDSEPILKKITALAASAQPASVPVVK